MVKLHKIKVKITNPFDSGESLLKQTPNDLGIWGNYHFLVNQDIEECDYWIVLDDLYKKEVVKVSPENVILFALESPSIKTYNRKFTEQFSTIVSCQQDIRHKNLIHNLTTVFWFVNKNYDELVNIEPFPKNKLISIITSNKLFTDGHKKRYEFAHALKDYFGKDMDLFGRGINEFNDKWDVLAPYKYSVAIENCYYPYWLTEKLCDCFLAYSYPFYYGCPNAENYFDSQSFIRIDINDIDKSKRIIEKTLNNDKFYDLHLDTIRANRSRYLNQYNFFKIAIQIIENNKFYQQVNPAKIQTLSPTNNFENHLIFKIKHFLFHKN
jgi:hypothetical protein